FRHQWTESSSCPVHVTFLFKPNHPLVQTKSPSCPIQITLLSNPNYPLVQSEPSSRPIHITDRPPSLNQWIDRADSKQRAVVKGDDNLPRTSNRIGMPG